jgi:hypothetical protein
MRETVSILAGVLVFGIAATAWTVTLVEGVGAMREQHQARQHAGLCPLLVQWQGHCPQP